MQSITNDILDLDGLKFGRYVPLKLLGKGAMGRVYLSLDPVLQRSVAVKVIALDEKIDKKTYVSFLERFTLEARASARLSHPSIVKVFDAGEQNGFPWIAFEYVDGESLEDLLIRDKQISNEKIKSILTDIASALKHAHEAGIVHRDVKPANILIEKKTGIAKLSDFGVVKAPFSMATQEGTTLGSPGYMSPEQIDGNGVDQRSDLFSLGIVYYQMLTGVHPFLRDTLQSTLYATIIGEYTPLRQIKSDIEFDTEQLITKLLKVKKEDRLISADDFLKSINKGSASVNDSVNVNLSGMLLKTGTELMKSVQPVINIVKKTDRMIMNTARNPKLQTAVRLSVKLLLKVFVKIYQTAMNLPVRKMIDTRKSRNVTIAAAVIVILSTLSIFIYDNYFNLTNKEKTVLSELAGDGYAGTPAQLMKQCSGLIDNNELNSAQDIAEAMIKIRRQSAHAYILNAIIELKDDDGDDAVEEIDKGKRVKGFNKVFRKEKRIFLNALKEYLVSEEIDRQMIDCVVYSLNLGKEHVIRQWAYEKPYWLRWNSIRILNETEFKVDMVEVYILDLKYAGSVRVRVRAANKLAEMKDKRAVTALDEVAKRGFADPIVSVAAQSALDQNKK